MLNYGKMDVAVGKLDENTLWLKSAILEIVR